jgi:uridine phosphorylase
MPVANALADKWEAWKRLGVLASEMEASTLYTVGATLGIATGAVFSTVWNQERFLLGLDSATDEVHNTERAIATAVEAIRILIAEGK